MQEMQEKTSWEKTYRTYSCTLNFIKQSQPLHSDIICEYGNKEGLILPQSGPFQEQKQTDTCLGT